MFDDVVSTTEAIDQLVNESYDLVITDLGRKGSSDHSNDAGANFLQHPAVRNGGPPVIVYAGRWAVVRRRAPPAGCCRRDGQPRAAHRQRPGTLGRKENPTVNLVR